MKITDMTRSENRSAATSGVALHMLMGNARAKTTRAQVVEISGRETPGVIQLTDAARIQASPKRRIQLML